MSNVPKYLDPSCPVHLSRRIRRGQRLLRPSPELNAALAGIVGHFAQANGIVLLAYAFASNHYHILAMAPSQEAASEFARGVNQGITMYLKRRYGWRRHEHIELWEGTLGQVALLDDVVVEKAFRYIVSHGCKEHLVEHPYDWPGLSSAHQIQTGVPDRGVWFDRTGYGDALRAGKDVTEEEFMEHHELRCVPLPSLRGGDGVVVDWSGRSGPELLEGIALMYAEKRIREGLGPVKGRYAVMTEDPFVEMPKELMPLPVCISSSLEIEEEYRARRRAYIDQYFGAKGVLYRHKDERPLTELMALFPEGSCVGHTGWRPMVSSVDA